MYIVPHPVIESYLDFCDKDCVDQEFNEKFLDIFLKALAIFGLPRHLLESIRRKICIVGSIREDASQGVYDLETLLRRHDLVLGAEMGGLANLFRSGIEDQAICSDKEIDFSGLDVALQNRIAPIGEALSALWAFDDIQDALSVSQPRVSVCIVLSAISRCVAKEKLVTWLSERPQMFDTCRLFQLEENLRKLDAHFVNEVLQEEDLQSFALWLLVYYVDGKITLQPLQKRLVDTLLNKAGLGSLALYE